MAEYVGHFKDMRPNALGAHSIRAALLRSGAPGGEIEQSPTRIWTRARNMQNLRDARALVGNGTLVPIIPVDLEALLILARVLLQVERADEELRPEMLSQL